MSTSPGDFSFATSEVITKHAGAVLNQQRRALLKSFPMRPTELRRDLRTDFKRVYKGVDHELLRKHDVLSKIHIPVLAVVGALPLKHIRLHGRFTGEYPLAKPQHPYLLLNVELSSYQEYNRHSSRSEHVQRMSCYEATALVLSFPELAEHQSLSALGYRFYYDPRAKAWIVSDEPAGYPSGRMVLFYERRLELGEPLRPESTLAAIAAASGEQRPIGLWHID